MPPDLLLSVSYAPVTSSVPFKPRSSQPPNPAAVPRRAAGPFRAAAVVAPRAAAALAAALAAVAAVVAADGRLAAVTRIPRRQRRFFRGPGQCLQRPCLTGRLSGAARSGGGGGSRGCGHGGRQPEERGSAAPPLPAAAAAVSGAGGACRGQEPERGRPRVHTTGAGRRARLPRPPLVPPEQVSGTAAVVLLLLLCMYLPIPLHSHTRAHAHWRLASLIAPLRLHSAPPSTPTPHPTASQEHLRV